MTHPVERTEADFSETVVPSTQGAKIAVRLWEPAHVSAHASARAVVVICHGFNSHSGQYAWTARQFASAGFAVVAPDLRGRGKSSGDRFFVNDMSEYVSDVSAAVQLAKSQHPGLPVFLLGHSAGGATACAYALDHQDQLAGLICESFAFQVPAPNFLLGFIKWLAGLAPRLPVLKLKNKDFSRDPAAVQALDADPLIANEKQPAQTVAALVRNSERLRREFPRITLPVLILHGTADKATVPAGSQFFYETAGSTDKTVRFYEGHFHDLLNDIGKEEVLLEIQQWIEDRLP